MTKPSPFVKLIVAVDANNGIGINGQLPWKLSGDMKFFRSITTKTKTPNLVNAVIMGRNTWNSIPESFRPLSNRLNVVLSRQAACKFAGAMAFTSLDDALNCLKQRNDVESIFIIGGSQVYKEALSYCDELVVTKIFKTFDCDTFFPEIPEDFKKISISEAEMELLWAVPLTKEENGVKYGITIYRKQVD